jgi:predicted metal-dependent enzyme (double-stranded beta helix superfamily)
MPTDHLKQSVAAATKEARIKRHREALWALRDALVSAENVEHWFIVEREREPEATRRFVEMGLIEISKGRRHHAERQLEVLQEMLDDLEGEE